MMSKIVTKESEFAIFEYVENDNCLIEELVSYLNQQAVTIFKFFELNKPKDKVTIKIVPTKEQFDKEFIARRPNWPNNCKVEKYARGEFCQFDNTIYYLSINDYKNTTHSFKPENYEIAVEGYKKTLVHEFVHYANYLFNIQNNNGWTSKYLVEGIATYLSKQKDNMDIKFDFTINDIVATGMEKSCYNGYYLITKYLIENYDKDFVLDLFTSSNQSKRFLENELFNKAKDYYIGKIV